MPIGGSTRVAGVIGWPIAHSLSPAMHNAGYRALGLDWAYVPVAVPPDRLAVAIPGLGAAGFAVQREQRWLLGSLAVVVAERLP